MTREGSSKKISRRKKVAVLLVVLLLPSMFYLVLNKGTHHFKKLPYIGPREVTGQGESIDTIFHTIPPFRFIDQDGEIFTNANLKGDIYVANFFFTRCPTICPKMAAHLLDLQQKFEKNDDVKIVSHTVDPEYDTAEVLKAYSEKVHADPEKWTFLTGSKDAIYDVAFNGYFANAQRDEAAPGGFLHSSLIFIVDRKGRLRGSYDDQGNIMPGFDGTSTSEMKKLSDALDNLLLEDYVPQKH